MLRTTAGTAQPSRRTGVGSLNGELINDNIVQSWQYTNVPATLTLTYGAGVINMNLDLANNTFPIPLMVFGTGTFQEFEDVNFSTGFVDPDSGTTWSFSATNTNDGISAGIDFQQSAFPFLTSIGYQASFQGSIVPEPSSLVLAASGLLVILIFAWVRGLFIR